MLKEANVNSCVLATFWLNTYMTKKLEELFDLPQDEDEEQVIDVDEVPEELSQELVTQDAMNNLAKIDSALPAIRGLESSDREMDDIAQAAMESYKDLMDLGMNVEARVANEIISSASQFLGHAITAKNAKITKKLKMIELQLRKAKLDHDREKAKPNGDDEDETTGKGRMLDRNELLAEVLAASQKDDKKD